MGRCGKALEGFEDNELGNLYDLVESCAPEEYSGEWR